MTASEIINAIKEYALPIVAIIGTVINAIYTAADRKTLLLAKDQLIQNLESENNRLKEWSPDMIEKFFRSTKKNLEDIITQLQQRIADLETEIKQSDEKIKSLKSLRANTEREKEEQNNQIKNLLEEKKVLTQKINELTVTSKMVDNNINSILTVSDSLGPIERSMEKMNIFPQGKADIWHLRID